MRYVLCVGEDEDGGLVVGPLGGILTFPNHEEAGSTAKRLLAGTLRETHPTWGVFVLKLVPTAFYIPMPGPADKDLVVDENILFEEEEPHGRN